MSAAASATVGRLLPLASSTGLALLVALAAGCGSAEQAPQGETSLQPLLASSFRAQGGAQLERLNQDELQRACSAELAPAPEVARRLEATQLATIQWPGEDGWLGDWRRGEALAQDGRGMTWSDKPGAPAGGNCYNCHQMAKAEISFGTLGPSLFQYGRLRGVTNPADPAALPVVRYTWAKLWNAKAYNACSGMPRFGHAGVLTAAQIKDLMALLLDPNSPVNAP